MGKVQCCLGLGVIFGRDVPVALGKDSAEPCNGGCCSGMAVDNVVGWVGHLGGVLPQA